MLHLFRSFCLLWTLDIVRAAVNCKQGNTLYEEDTALDAVQGCYKVFHAAATWQEAKAHCEDSTPGGYNGALAAARSQEEQDFLMFLISEIGWGQTFWMSGNSIPDSRSDGHWSWGAPYFIDVRFRDTAWRNGMIVNTLPRGAVGDVSYLGSRALVNGYQGAYAWKIANISEKHSFICRKQACEAGKDVLYGLCKANAVPILFPDNNDADSTGWIVAVVIVVILVVVLVTVLLLWLLKKTLFVAIKSRVYSGICCKKNKKQITGARVADGDADDFIPPFVTPVGVKDSDPTFNNEPSAAVGDDRRLSQQSYQIPPLTRLSQQASDSGTWPLRSTMVGRNSDIALSTNPIRSRIPSRPSIGSYPSMMSVPEPLQTKRKLNYKS